MVRGRKAGILLVLAGVSFLVAALLNDPHQPLSFVAAGALDVRGDTSLLEISTDLAESTTHYPRRVGLMTHPHDAKASSLAQTRLGARVGPRLP
jgi:hypothetical protein